MTPASENFGSTAQIMLEVLDRAALELSKIVAECMEMVVMSGLSLQRSLMFQLRCTSENYQSFADGKFDELDRKKQSILTELQRFEESQIETVESTARIVRDAVIEHTEAVVSKIAQQLNDNAPRGTQKNPNVLLKDCYEMAKPAIEKTFHAGQQRLEQIFNACSTQSESKANNCTNQLSQQLEGWNTRMSTQLDEVLSKFEQQYVTVMEKLQSFISESTALVDANSRQLTQQAEGDLQKSLLTIDKSVKGWKSGFSSTYESLDKDLIQKQEQEQTRTVDLLHENLDEANSYFAHLTADSAEKAYETHRSYVAALGKIENTCVQRLEHLHEYFESLLAGYNGNSTETVSAETLSAEEHRSRLEANLSAHSSQAATAATALVSQLESDLSRNSQFLKERIETVKNESADYFRGQVRGMEAESDRAVREFRRDITKLENSVKEIEDAGQAAAVTVTAYLGTVLSLEE